MVFTNSNREMRALINIRKTVYAAVPLHLLPLRQGINLGKHLYKLYMCSSDVSARTTCTEVTKPPLIAL